MTTKLVTITKRELSTLLTAAARWYITEGKKNARRKTLRKDASVWAMEMSALRATIEKLAKVRDEA